MSKKKFLVSLFCILGLGGLCVYLNKDSFAKKPIQISHRSSPSPLAARGKQTTKVNPVVFSFDRYYRFKEIKVVLAEDIATNKYAHALWHLVSETNSHPMTSFGYGARLHGMLPKVKGNTPEPLEAGVKYRLMVTTADDQAEHEFTASKK